MLLINRFLSEVNFNEKLLRPKIIIKKLFKKFKNVNVQEMRTIYKNI